MSKPIAIAASLTVLALIGGTYAFTRLATPSLEQCSTTAIAGGDIGGPFTLVNGAGETVTETDVITEPTLIYFGYTFCPDVCPLDASRNVAAIDILAEDGVSATPVFISIDPERDTPDVVADFAANFHPKMIGLTGTAAQVDAASKAYKTYYSKADDDPDYYLINHSVFSYLALPDIGVVDFFKQADSPEQVAERVACFAAAS